MDLTWVEAYASSVTQAMTPQDQLVALDHVLKFQRLHTLPAFLQHDPVLLYTVAGILGETQITEVGHWLCSPPEQPLWTLATRGFEEPHPILRHPPFRCLFHVLEGKDLKTESRAHWREQLAWMLTGPQFYTSKDKPFLRFIDVDLAASELQVTLARPHLKWLLAKSAQSPVARTLQMLGILRHSNIHEFWIQSNVSYVGYNDTHRVLSVPA